MFWSLGPACSNVEFPDPLHMVGFRCWCLATSWGAEVAGAVGFDLERRVGKSRAPDRPLLSLLGLLPAVRIPALIS